MKVEVAHIHPLLLNLHYKLAAKRLDKLVIVCKTFAKEDVPEIHVRQNEKTCSKDVGAHPSQVSTLR